MSLMWMPAQTTTPPLPTLARASGTNSPDGRVVTNIEGIPNRVGDPDYATYGGTDDLDNSGILKYISIRYGGYIIASSKEVNGLSLAGIGRSTVIDHIDIYNTKDDNIEFFGGTVNTKYMVTWA